MVSRNAVRELIRTLEEGRFFAECPCCGDRIQLKDAGLFYLDEFTPESKLKYVEWLNEIKQRRNDLKDKRKKIPALSEKGAQAVNIGFILERIAPSLKDFRFERNDCRSLFDPIDYKILDGLTRSGHVQRIVFIDIKTGSARLNDHQREIRQLVQDGSIELATYAPVRKS